MVETSSRWMKATEKDSMAAILHLVLQNLHTYELLFSLKKSGKALINSARGIVKVDWLKKNKG